MSRKLYQSPYVAREVVTVLLQQYKEHPCLWDTEDSLYSNVENRKAAYESLLETYKKFEKDANIISLKKKIDNLRASYKRECKKILKNRHHVPSLWYFNLMTFLDKGRTIAGSNSESDNEEEKSATDETLPTVFCPVESYRVKPSSEKDGNNYIIKTDQILETEAFGRAVGLQLNELTTMQKTIAEKLISDIVYYGRLEKLTINTHFVNLLDHY